MIRDRPEMSIELCPRTVADYLKYNRRSGAGGGDDAQHAYVRMVRGGQDDMHENGSRSKNDTSYTLITYVPIQCK